MQTWDLWEHQQEAVDEINKAWDKGHKSICCQLPTGSGKTRVIRTIVDQFADRKQKVYIIAHRNTLVKQLSKELVEAGLQHGIIRAGSPYIKYRVQVCSMQTLVRRVNNLPEPGLIIVDECHHLKSSSYLSILEKWSKSKVLGMTATPQRQDGKTLSDIFDTLILGPSMKHLIKLGKLSDYDYYAPENIDMSDVHTRAGEYISKESLEKVDKACITGNVISHYKKYADHKPTICCCISIAHSEHVAKDFRDAGYKAIAVNSKMKTAQVDAAIAGLGNGNLEILTQCDMLGEGVDIPGVECLIQLRPTQSLVIFMQQCGRSLRAVKGKDKAIILDHVGNWSRFGLPDDNRIWSLEGKKKKDKGVSKTKRCPECLQVSSVSARVCPNCGFQWTETLEAGTRTIEEKEGELISVKSVGKAAEQELIRALAFAHNVREAKKIARTMGYKDGDATAVWFGVFHNKIDTIKKF